MEAESFFARWEKRNADAAVEKQASEAMPVSDVRVPDEVRPPPTLEDVALLTPDSDFTPFVARGVDEQIRRSAMKKLFADPRFNVMDGLDVYIEDYNKYTPIPAAMLAALNHARSLLDPLAQLDNPLMKLLDAVPQDEEDGSPAAPDDASEPDAPPPPKEQNSHDDPVQDL